MQSPGVAEASLGIENRGTKIRCLGSRGVGQWLVWFRVGKGEGSRAGLLGMLVRAIGATS